MTRESTRLADRLRKTLEQEIVTGTLQPGTRLDEASLGRRFGVSRTPVREALTQLASAGLVAARRHHGAVVAEVSVKDLLQMFEVMAELEAFCARLAARRMTPEDHEALDEALETCRARAREGRSDAYYDANAAFHEVIYLGSHNDFLANQTHALRNRLQAYRRTQLRQPGRVDTSLAEHEAIVAAIRAGDPEAAAQAMQRHVSIQGDTFTDFVSTLPAARLASAG